MIINGADVGMRRLKPRVILKDFSGGFSRELKSDSGRDLKHDAERAVRDS